MPRSDCPRIFHSVREFFTRTREELYLHGLYEGKGGVGRVMLKDDCAMFEADGTTLKESEHIAGDKQVTGGTEGAEDGNKAAVGAEEQKFIERTVEKTNSQGCPFVIVGDSMVRVNINKELFWLRPASMAAHSGSLHFARDPGLINEGLVLFLYKAFTGETSFLGVAEGRGQLYLANGNHQVILLYLDNEAINLQGCSVLAFEDRLEHSVQMMGNAAGVIVGGLYSLHLEGSGWVAFTSCGSPVTVKCDDTLSCVPIKALAWSEGLVPQVQSDVTRVNLMGRGVTDMLHMVFTASELAHPSKQSVEITGGAGAQQTGQTVGYVTMHGDEEYMYPRIK